MNFMRILLLSLAADTASTVFAAQAVTFDVASVKAVKTGSGSVARGNRGGPGTSEPGRLYRTVSTINSLICEAFGVRSDVVIGPGWMADRQGPYSYVVDATMPPGTTKEQFRVMLQNLLKERFHLAVHREVRSFPGYDLVIAMGGPKLKPAGSLPKSVFTIFSRDSSRFVINQHSMAQLVDQLPVLIAESLGVDASIRVRDKTGFAARFDGILEYSCVAGCGPPQLRAREKVGGAAQRQPAPTTSDPPNSRIPNIAVALQEQLGLRLVKVKAIPTEVIVVDHITRTPTEN
jgi:uncharacterized protein (TIGR03435 family)